jgi:hypothetical protein
MAKFYGQIGYGENVETFAGSGVWQDIITEYPYYGDLVRNSRSLESGEKVNDDISVGNSISIVADQMANEHFFKMKYVVWAGARWTVTKVDVLGPRLTLSLGGVYNGPTA